MEPDGRRSGTAVVDKGEGALAHVLDVAAGVGDGENAGGGFALFIFDERGGSGGLVSDGLAADFDGVVGDGGFFFGRGRLRGGFGFGGLGVFF